MSDQSKGCGCYCPRCQSNDCPHACAVHPSLAWSKEGLLEALLQTQKDARREAVLAYDDVRRERDAARAELAQEQERHAKTAQDRDIVRLHHHSLWQLVASCATTPTEAMDMAREKLAQLDRAEKACSTWAAEVEQAKWEREEMRSARDSAWRLLDIMGRERDEMAEACGLAREHFGVGVAKGLLRDQARVQLLEQELSDQRRARIIAENERAKAEDKYQALLVSISEAENKVGEEDFRCDDCHEEVQEADRCQACRTRPRTRLDHETGQNVIDEATADRCVRCCRDPGHRPAKPGPAPECPRCGRLVQDCPRAQWERSRGLQLHAEVALSFECRAHEYLTRALAAEAERDQADAALDEREAYWEDRAETQRKAYLLVADAVCKESDSPEQVAEIARVTRRELKAAQLAVSAAAQIRARLEERLAKVEQGRDMAVAAAGTLAQERDEARRLWQAAEQELLAKKDRFGCITCGANLSPLCESCQVGVASSAGRLLVHATPDTTATRRLPPPRPTAGPAIVDLVLADLRDRADAGEKHYGQPLRAFNGRPSGIDAYHEDLDRAMYGRQDIEEKRATLHRVREALRSYDGALTIGPAYALLQDIERWLAPYDAAPAKPEQLAQQLTPADGHPTPEWVTRQVVPCDRCKGTRVIKGDGCPDFACPECPPAKASGPVCATCQDTHVMSLEDLGDVPCTHCPVPCQKCRLNGTGPYCAEPQCKCPCHWPAQKEVA